MSLVSVLIISRFSFRETWRLKSMSRFLFIHSPLCECKLENSATHLFFFYPQWSESLWVRVDLRQARGQCRAKQANGETRETCKLAEIMSQQRHVWNGGHFCVWRFEATTFLLMHVQHFGKRNITAYRLCVCVWVCLCLWNKADLLI